MRIEKNNVDTTYINRNNDKTEEGKNSATSQKNEDSSNVVYAGDLNLNDDVIGDKKLQAQKKALKTLMDQFSNEGKTDTVVSDLQDKQDLWSKDRDTDSDTINNLDQSSQELMDSLGITQDSTEQKDLKKSEDQNMSLYLKSIQHPDKMSEKDKAKLQSVMDSLTDYQKNAFHNDAMKKILQDRVSDATYNIQSIDKAISGVKLEKLKSHPMVDAQKQAEDIMKDANEDIINTLMQQTKDKVDETTQENKDKVEKGQEEQDKKDKEAEKAKDAERAKQEDKIKQEEIAKSTSNMQNTDNNGNTQVATPVDTSISQADQQQLLDSIKRVADKQNMIEDDIKGIVVDEQV